MLRLALMLAAVIVEYVCGRPPLPPLPMKDGCYRASQELSITRMDGEAVILSFPMFRRVLKVHNLAPRSASYLITRGNGTVGGQTAYEGSGRVQQQDKQLWFLPAQASDSGEYICTYRNDTYCVTGSIMLHVFESSSVDMKKLSYPISVIVGEQLTFPCPSLDLYNKTGRLVTWYKDFSSTAFQLGRVGSFNEDGGKLKIPAVRRFHAGVYTCQLTVLIHEQQYNVSRSIWLKVQGQDPVITTTVHDLSPTTDPEVISSSSYKTVQALITQPPVIVSPLNGTVFESAHGSGLELFCQVLTECQMENSTAVTWLVNGQSVESSYLDRRALQGGRRVTKVSERCQIELRLAVVAVTEEDEKTELKCVAQNRGGRQEVVVKLQLEDSTFTWLVVGVGAASCFLAVVSIFLYVLFKPIRKKKMDYILARQNSTF